MRRFLSSKLTIVALVLTVVILITGVTWAANSSSPGNQLTSSVVEIVPVSLGVVEGGNLQVAGAGFAPGEVVLFQIIMGGDTPNIIIEGGFANDSGAFLAQTDLPSVVTAGLYTVRALITGGIHVASTPLIVCAASEGKCP